MIELLLYSQLDSPFMIHVLWGMGILSIIVLIVLIVLQRRTGLKLKDELVELDRMKEGNVEYEFVVKAMKLSTWHVNPKLRTITMDNDFRQGQDNLMPSPDYPLALLCEMLDKSDAQRVMTALDDILTGRSNSYHQQYRIKSGNSGMTYWEESYAIIADRDAEGNPTKVVGTTMRIDERKKLEADLINARNKAEESDRLKTAFLANMGHEIRTPLNAIVGFADLLPVVQDEEERSQLITEIQNNNQKLLHIIDGLVSMSKIEAGAKSLLLARVDLNQLLQQMIDTYQPTTNIPITLHCALKQLMIESDRDKLYEVIDNLMQNAVKFTTEGSIRIGYDLMDNNRVHLWVTDTGKGISASDQQRIFERFVKLDEYIPGTGLGLSVAKSHVQSLGGNMGVESEIGKGSTFWVDLPLA